MALDLSPPETLFLFQIFLQISHHLKLSTWTCINQKQLIEQKQLIRLAIKINNLDQTTNQSSKNHELTSLTPHNPIQTKQNQENNFKNKFNK